MTCCCPIMCICPLFPMRMWCMPWGIPCGTLAMSDMPFGGCSGNCQCHVVAPSGSHIDSTCKRLVNGGHHAAKHNLKACFPLMHAIIMPFASTNPQLPSAPAPPPPHAHHHPHPAHPHPHIHSCLHEQINCKFSILPAV